MNLPTQMFDTLVEKEHNPGLREVSRSFNPRSFASLRTYEYFIPAHIIFQGKDLKNMKMEDIDNYYNSLDDSRISQNVVFFDSLEAKRYS